MLANATASGEEKLELVHDMKVGVDNILGSVL